MIDHIKTVWSDMQFKVQTLTDTLGGAVSLLLARLLMANVFLSSGWLKFENALNGNWHTTVFLFRYEHPVPFLPAPAAAILGTGGELIFGILVLLGLFGRLGAFGLLIITAVIEFTYIHSMDHVYWATILLLIFCFGSGKISLDRMLK